MRTVQHAVGEVVEVVAVAEPNALEPVDEGMEERCAPRAARSGAPGQMCGPAPNAT